MTYIVRRFEMEGADVVAAACSIPSHEELWRAQNEAERLARAHHSHTYDQDLRCWQGRDADGRTYRYLAERRA